MKINKINYNIINHKQKCIRVDSYNNTVRVKHQDCDTFVRQNQRVTNSLTFGREIHEKEEKHCKAIINGTALACAGVSAAGGKASPYGIDAWTLRGLQTGMFVYLSQYLEVGMMPTFEHAAVEFTSGSYLGCEGSKMATAIAGTIADVVSGGTAEPISDGVVRCFNAGISAAITKKMGNSFVKQVKYDRMTKKDQTLRLINYASNRIINSAIGGSGKMFDNHSIDNINNKAYIAEILKKNSWQHMDLYDIVIKNIISRAIPKTTANFISSMVTYNAFAKAHKDKVDNKQLAKEIARNAFITSAVYEMFDVGTDFVIKKEVADTVIDISEHMCDYPEVFKVFEDFFDKANKNENLEKICSDGFFAQFKNKDFMTQFSNLTSHSIQQFITLWSHKRKYDMDNIQNKQHSKIKELQQGNNEKEEQIKKDKEELNLIIQNQHTKIYKNLNNLNTFGYSKIAGYDEQKAFLQAYLNSLSNIDNCDSEDLANAILFFGPRGNGKTTFASALAEEFGCKYRSIDTTSNKEKAKIKLEKELNKAKECWDKEKRNSILLIDECTAFMNKTDDPQKQQLNKEIAQLIEESASKYHAMIFMTTNYPEKIDPIFYNNGEIEMTVALDPPNEKNAEKVFKYYTQNDDIDYNKIMAIFNKQCQKTRCQYSNSQIKNMVNQARLQNDNGHINTYDLQKIIEETKPEITKDDLERFEQNKRIMTNVPNGFCIDSCQKSDC